MSRSETVAERGSLREHLYGDAGAIDRVCHELRRPISAIGAYVELLADELTGPLTREQKAHVAVLGRNVRRVNRSIEDLFHIFHTLAADWQPRLEPVEIEELACEVVEALVARFRERGVRLSLRAEGPAFHAAVDRQRLKTSLERLLTSCLEAAPMESEIQLELRGVDGRLRFEVRDSGPSLTKEDADRAFDFLYRTERSRFVDEAGGAALSVCRCLMESQGGATWAENRSGEGTVYVLELPA